mgnify:CR=1 FL=1
MGQPDIKEIEAGLKDWDFVRNLPAAIGDYTCAGLRHRRTDFEYCSLCARSVALSS